MSKGNSPYQKEIVCQMDFVCLEILFSDGYYDLLSVGLSVSLFVGPQLVHLSVCSFVDWSIGLLVNLCVGLSVGLSKCLLTLLSVRARVSLAEPEMPCILTFFF